MNLDLEILKLAKNEYCLKNINNLAGFKISHLKSLV